MKSWWENVSLDFFSETKVQRYGEPYKNLPELYISPRLLAFETNNSIFDRRIGKISFLTLTLNWLTHCRLD